MNDLVKLFGSSPRIKVMALFLANPDKVFNKSSLAVNTGISRQTLYAQDLLSDLCSIGLIKRVGAGYQLFVNGRIANLLRSLK